MKRECRSQKPEARRVLIGWIFSFLLLLVLAAGCQASADEKEPVGVMREAGRLYEKAKYSEATALYQKLVSEGYRAPALFYNLGCAAYRAGDPGRAVLSFERARRLSPRDGDIRHNLSVVRAHLKDEIPPGSGWAARLFEFFTLNELALATSVLWFLLAACLGFYLLRRREGWLWGALILGLFLLLCGSWLGGRLYVESRPRAVILAKETAVKNGPGGDYSTAFVLHEGTMVTILSRQREWVEVAAFGRLKGWLPAADEEEI